MMKQKLFFVLAFLCLYLASLQAQSFPNTYQPHEFFLATDDHNNVFLSRTASFTNTFRITATPYNQTPYTGWFDKKYFNNAVPAMRLTINDGESMYLNSNQFVDITLPEGKHRIKLEMTLAAFHIWTCRTIDFEVKRDAPYQRPDSVWNIKLPAAEFTPPISNLYPEESTLSHYNDAKEVEAVAIIKLGEGNDKLTRPIIIVDGVDFSHDIVLDNEGRIIRFGDTGWENVIQGLTTSFEKDNQELFEHYPKLLNQILTESQEEDLPNYDVILVEFKDGADYIDRCALLLQKVIERVNATKDCGFENVLMGLSMGGQVSRFALTGMEQKGIDHDCREYISFDSPHEYANIPLGIQAFIYSAGYLAGQRAIKAKFQNLNRPAAIQMLQNNLYTEVAKGNVSFTRSKVFWDTSDEKVEEVKQTIWMEAKPKTEALRTYYLNQQKLRGYPKYCKNIAMANGSGRGTAHHLTPCTNDGTLLDGSMVNNDSWIKHISKVLLPYPIAVMDMLLKRIDDDIFSVKINSVGGVDNEIMRFSFPTTDDGICFNKVILRRNIPYINVDQAAGGLRGDLDYLQTQLDDPDLPWELEYLTPAKFDVNWYCNARKTTFMPTASVLGMATDDLEMDLEVELSKNNITSPFDEVFLPKANLDHVDLKHPSEEDYAGNANYDSLIAYVGGNAFDLASIYVLPNAEQKSVYNYGLYRKRLTSFVLNAGAKLLVNNKGKTHFQQAASAEKKSPKDDFYVGALDKKCHEPISIIANAGALIELGDPTNSKSGHVELFNTSKVYLNAGSSLRMQNRSSLSLQQGSYLEIADNVDFRMEGNETELFIDGHLKTTGDVTIHCNGQVRFGSNATFDIGGKLTIIGDNIKDDLLIFNKNANFAIKNHDFELKNGSLKFGDYAKIRILNANQVNISNIRINNERYNAMNLIQMKQVQQVDLGNIEISNIYQGYPISITGYSSAQVNIQNASIHNCQQSLIVKNAQKLTIENSDFTSKSFSEAFKNKEYFTGVQVENTNELDVTNCNFEGFGNDDTSVGEEFGIVLKNVHRAAFNSSQFSNNKYGILAPKTGKDINSTNRTNIFLKDVSIVNNRIGIEMHGYVAQAVNEYNYGYLYMDCVRLMENYKYGVYGTEILVQADNYFTDMEASANRFKNHDPKHSTVFKVEYTSANNYYNPIYLRGNIWYTPNPQNAFYNSTTGDYYTINYAPMIDGNGMTQACIGGKQNPVVGLNCDGCFKSDDSDCYFIAGGGKESIASVFRKGTKGISNGDFATAGTELSKILTIPNSVRDGLPSKCRFAYEVSRVFALPNPRNDEKIQIRATGDEDELALRVTPVPSSDYIQIEGMSAGRYQIMNTNGAKVKSGVFDADTRIDVSDLAGSMYFLRTIAPNGKIQTTSFIVIK